MCNLNYLSAVARSSIFVVRKLPEMFQQGKERKTSIKLKTFSIYTERFQLVSCSDARSPALSLFLELNKHCGDADDEGSQNAMQTKKAREGNRQKRNEERARYNKVDSLLFDVLHRLDLCEPWGEFNVCYVKIIKMFTSRFVDAHTLTQLIECKQRKKERIN